MKLILIFILAGYALRLYSGLGKGGVSIGYLLMGSTLIIHGGYIIWRGLSLGRLPLVGVHDTVLFTAFTTALFSLLIEWKQRIAAINLTAIPVVIILVLVGIVVFEGRVDTPLPPVLNTYWFELHVVLSFISYALFTIGMGAGLLYLWDGKPALERLQYSVILTGYSLFSLSMAFGGVWAYLAWGTYWLWTPKELWTTILWLYFSLYLHGRLVRGWMGRPVVWMGVAGFGLMIFLWLGVSLLMKSSHSFT